MTFFASDLKPSREYLIRYRGRNLHGTAAFASYWYLAAERQAMFFRRLRGDAMLTHDAILRKYRFTNAYRAADRVSQYAIREIQAASGIDAQDIVFRLLLFKIFNRIETWKLLEQELGESILWSTFRDDRYVDALARIASSGQPLYANAYMMPNPNFGLPTKHANHIELIRSSMEAGLTKRLMQARSLEDVYKELRMLPSLGPFLAFQFAIDLNYSDLLPFAESEFVVAGPGAIDGIRKCFRDTDSFEPADIIRMMADIADKQFARFDLNFVSLWGRPLQLIDCQNLFCETDKYARIAHPELSGKSGRVKIKQRFSISSRPLPQYVFPKRWNIVATPDSSHIARLQFYNS